MERIINWIKKSIGYYELEQEKETLKNLLKENTLLINKLIFEKEEYLKELKGKNHDLETFMNWLEQNVIQVNKTHKLSADFHNRIIRNIKIRPSYFLRLCVLKEDEEKILEFAQETLYWKTFKDEDDLVFNFNTRFDALHPTKQYYKYDKELYKHEEYWATPIQTINNIKKNKTFGDCDDVSHLKYWCLKLLLNKYFPNWNKKRLRCFLNFVMGYEYHAMLSWVKKDVNDWVPIETTYYNVRFSEFWLNNYTLRNNQIGYKIDYSYDEESEYEKI